MHCSCTFAQHCSRLPCGPLTEIIHKIAIKTVVHVCALDVSNVHHINHFYPQIKSASYGILFRVLSVRPSVCMYVRR